MKTLSPIKQAIATRHLYRYEEQFLCSFPLMSKQRNLKSIRSKAKKIWNHYYQGKRSCPKINFGPGDYSLGRSLSYCLGYDYIELAPNQRDWLTLMHELVHAMGADYHDMKFTKKYFEILKDHLPNYILDQVYSELIIRHKELLRPYK